MAGRTGATIMGTITTMMITGTITTTIMTTGTTMTMVTRTGTSMTDASLIRLMSWLSPVFPTGGFAWSAGLEQAVADGTVRRACDLGDWLSALLAHGSPWNDAVVFAAAWRAREDAAAIGELAELAGAMAGSAERHRETMDQGRAFLAAASHWFPGEAWALGELPLPVAVGLACGRGGIALEAALGAYLNGFISGQLQCAIRLSVTGQNGAAGLLRRLEPNVAQAAARAAVSTLDDLGAFAMRAEIASMNHETLQPRLFLS